MKPELETLLRSWSWEIESRVNRVRSLIGSAHWASDGAHKEGLVESFLASRLPPDVEAGHGFLMDTRTNRCSREIDVLLRDTRQSAPLFSESGITICHPSAATAFLEIKSGFRKDALDAALDLVRTTQQLVFDSGSRQTIWRGIVFFGMDETDAHDQRFQVLLNALRESAKKQDDLGGKQDILPTCVCSVGEFCAFVAFDKGQARYRVKYFPIADLSFAVAMSDLLSHVYQRPTPPAHFVLDGTIEDLVSTMPLLEEF